MRLRPHQDALGQALYTSHNGGHAYELIERDDGYVDLSGGPNAYTTAYHDWADCEKRAIKHARGRVLDIGCGAGRHAVYLQERGHHVLGIDVSPLALKVAKLRGLRRTRLLSITKVSRQLGTFDTMLMLGNNFGLVERFAAPLTRRLDEDLQRRRLDQRGPLHGTVQTAAHGHVRAEPWPGSTCPSTLHRGSSRQGAHRSAKRHRTRGPRSGACPG